MHKRLLSVFMTVILVIGVFCEAPSAFAEEKDAPQELVFGIDRTYLCAGEALNVSNPQEYELKYFVGDEEVVADSFVLSTEYYEKWITVKAYNGGVLADEDRVYFSKLPVLYISTDDGEPITSKEVYKTGEMLIQNNTAVSEAIYDGALSIKGRGNTTWYWPKKPYRIKLDKKTDLFGMGTNKNWVLLANYLDECLLRNTTAFQISEEAGLTTVKSVWTDVVLNGEYVGNYQLCEQIRIDENRVDVFDWEEEAKSVASAVAKAEKKNGNTIDKDALEDHLTEHMDWITSGTFDFGDKTYAISEYYDIQDNASGGYLFEMSEEYDEISKFTTDAGLFVMIKSPEYLSTNSEMTNYVTQYWQCFENAYRSEDGYADTPEGRKHYSELADIDSMVAYWLVLEIMGNNDACKKSRYAYKDIDGLIEYGPVWDFDWGCGSLMVGTSAKEWELTLSDNKQNFFKDFVDDPLFIAKATEKYWQLRPYLESLIAEGGIIDSEVEYLMESGLADHERWNRLETWGPARGFAKDADKFITYLRRRIEWLDEQFATDDSLLRSTYTTLSAAPYQRANNDLVITLTDASSDTAEHAPSDGAVGIDWSVSVNVKVNNADTSMISVYVNGISYENIPCIDGSASFRVSNSKLYEDASKKNVISLIGKNSDGETTCKNFTTVTRMDYAGIDLLGDTNDDGEVTILDATTIQRKLAVLTVKNPEIVVTRGDITVDGLDILDATMIQRYLAAFDTPYMIGQPMK